DQPLWAMLNEPLMHDGRSRGFVLNDAATLTAGLMARLVDIPAACERRQVPRHLQGQVVFQLDDPVLAANRASFALCFEHGQLSAVPAQTTPEASCDIVTLSQLWCGVLRASSALRQGHLHTSPQTAELLDQVFATPGPFIHPADWF
ncbi:MAG: sterol carrier protein domain-containing protein, partial [Chloroflexota bacterium]|nr:sterol carrier protein domain-containing protein [Chloroflexota bacterium]